ncbi:hypothetical protein [Thermococcus waiotapuensis]|uniref:Uncharacterized protein n=1 Tax=Thermococcus waiotapuensis TaxID=90909 RepID=A0AAE4T2N4_9EURY|nr:hypothetical protein [Thermococcus waiotapuensis]MDV3104242.1 hypothetical protein [Thermococcus waiotapuensis]
MKSEVFIVLFVVLVFSIPLVVAGGSTKPFPQVEGSVLVVSLNQTGSETYMTVPFLTNTSGGNVVYKGWVKVVGFENLGKKVRITLQFKFDDPSSYLENLTGMDLLNDGVLNKTITTSFLVDRESNTFELNGTWVFFPFLFLQPEESRPFHIFEFLRTEKYGSVRAELANGIRVEVADALELYSTGTFQYLFCSASIATENVTCEEPIELRYANVMTKSHYVFGADVLFPSDPFGIYRGPVMLSFQLAPSEDVLRVLRERNGDGKFYMVIPILVGIAVLGLILRRGGE